MSNDFFKMRGIVKQYQMGNEVQTILKGIDLDIEEGEFLSILGPSGSGKSTLMNIIGCLDTPTSGEYILHGRTIRDLDEKQLAHIRSKEIGFIFQQFQPVQQVFSAVCEVTASSICVFNPVSHKPLLHIHHFGQYHFIYPASYIICPANPFHLISGFQFFCNVFLFHYLLHK